jgi:hypothetical protein
MTRLSFGYPKFILLLFLWILIMQACTKSGVQNSPNNTNQPSPPFKSLVVSYPFFRTDEFLFYNFQHDSLANTYTIDILDSSTVFEGVYARMWTTKVYYLTPTLPRRVSKITVRRTSQASQYGPVNNQDNYDFEYQFNDNGYIPGHIKITVYVDAAATAIKSQLEFDVYNPTINWYDAAGPGDLLNWNNLLPLRQPLKLLRAGCCFLKQYTDSSFEVENNSNDYSFTLFYNVPNQAPGNQVATGNEHGIYIFNKDHLLSTMAMDIVGTYTDPSTGWVSLTNFSVAYQRRLDFTYLNQQPASYSIFNVSGIPEAIYWEQVCEYLPGIYGSYAYPRVDSYNTYDPYIVDLHTYYKDICDSYTDSLFTTDASANKILVSQNRYFNKVVMNGDTVSRIIKTDAAGNILRNIELKY